MSLLTVLQISDLHLGGEPKGLDETTSWHASTRLALMAHLPLFRGLLGHHRRAVIALEDFWGDLLLRDRASRLLVTGDVTASGHPDEFSLGNDFLSSPGLASTGFRIGLASPAWSKNAVSGNHDNWPGCSPPLPFGRSNPALRACLPGPYPMVHAPLALANGSSVRFLFVDSDADVGPFSLDRLLARGSFSSQLAALSRKLGPPADREFRVLVMHHSITKEGSGPGQAVFSAAGPAFPPERSVIDPTTLQDLEPVLVRLGVRVVLCGHLHAACLTGIHPSADGRSIPVLEARCGSTTQLDTLPNTPTGTLPTNTLILHELFDRAGATVWRSTIHWLTTGNRFVAGVTAPGTQPWHSTEVVTVSA